MSIRASFYLVQPSDAICAFCRSLQFPGTLSPFPGLQGKEQETRSVRSFRRITGKLAIAITKGSC